MSPSRVFAARGKLAWTLIAATALGLRLTFVLCVPQIPVSSDSQQYDLAGREVARWIGPDFPRLVMGFVHWRVPVLREFAGSLSSMVMIKGPIYPAFLGFLYLLFGHHYAPVRVAQAILDSITALLVGRVSQKTGGRTGGLAAAALYATYPPMILMVGRLMQETIIMFLLALLLWLMTRLLEPEHVPRAGELVATGAVLGAILVGKPSLQYLFVLLLPAYFVARTCSGATKLREISLIVAGSLPLVIPVMLFLTILTGHISLNSALSFKYEADFFYGIHPCSRGWFPDLPNREGDTAPVNPAAVPGLVESRTYGQALSAYLQEHPAAPLRRALPRLYAFYALPCAEGLEDNLLSRPLVVTWHKILVILGLFGAACSLRDWKRTLPLLTVAIYVTGVALLTQTNVRLVLPALIAWAPLAGIGVARLGAGARTLPTRFGAVRASLLVASTAVLLLAFSVLGVSILLAALPIGDPQVALFVSWVSRGLLLSLLIFILQGVLPARQGDRSRHVGLILAGVLVFAVTVSHDREGESWREWKATLDSASKEIEQVFRLPEGVHDIRSVRLFADVEPRLNAGEVLRIRIGDDEVARLTGESIGGDCFRGYLKEAGERWQGGYYPLQQYGTLDLSRMRKWLEVPLPENLPEGEELRVRLDLPEGGSLAVYGDFVSAREPSRFTGPTLEACHVGLRTSCWKFINDRDYRVRQTIRLAGQAKGRWREGQRVQELDLSPASGLQSGRYRVFMVIERMNGKRLVVGAGDYDKPPSR